MSTPAKPRDSDLKFRTMDILVDAGNRQLDNIDQKKIQELVEYLKTITDENRAAQQLKTAQRKEYDRLMTKMNEFLATLGKIELELPPEVRQEMNSMQRKQRAERIRRIKEAQAERGAPEYSE